LPKENCGSKLSFYCNIVCKNILNAMGLKMIQFDPDWQAGEQSSRGSLNSLSRAIQERT